MIEKFLLQAPAGDLKHYYTSLHILFSLPLHLLLPHFKTAHLQMILFPLFQSGPVTHLSPQTSSVHQELEERLRHHHHAELQSLREAHRHSIETLKQQSEQELQTLRFELEDEGKAMLGKLALCTPVTFFGQFLETSAAKLLMLRSETISLTQCKTCFEI